MGDVCLGSHCRGREAKTLAGLHHRIMTLFVELLEMPEYNPEAAALKNRILSKPVPDPIPRRVKTC